MNTIQATELRIGNFIGMNLEEYPNNFFTALEVGETMKVYEGLITLKGANIKRVETSFMYVDDLDPIPLTEDWLVRLGFREQLNAHKTHILFLKDIFSLAQKEDLWSAALVTVTVYPLRVKLKYVHQLQNLYFALTGTELTLTDK